MNNKQEKFDWWTRTLGLDFGVGWNSSKRGLLQRITKEVLGDKPNRTFTWVVELDENEARIKATQQAPREGSSEIVINRLGDVFRSDVLQGAAIDVLEPRVLRQRKFSRDDTLRLTRSTSMRESKDVARPLFFKDSFGFSDKQAWTVRGGILVELDRLEDGSIRYAPNGWREKQAWLFGRDVLRSWSVGDKGKIMFITEKSIVPGPMNRFRKWRYFQSGVDLYNLDALGPAMVREIRNAIVADPETQLTRDHITF